jgi:hypothetical protein
MTDAKQFWHEKSDDGLIEAAANLDHYVDDVRAVIRAELKRRGLEDPVEQANETVEDAPAAAESVTKIEPKIECLRCHIPLRFVGTREFPEGSHFGIFGDLVQVFENSESFDLYVCLRCGHVELFVDLGEE